MCRVHASCSRAVAVRARWLPVAPQVLRGFEKVMLAPGASETITFALDSGLLSVWDAKQHGWAPVQGTFQVWIGASSRDIKLTGTLTHANSAATVPAWV